MSRRPVDLAELERVIRLGCADAARDAGLLNFTLQVSVRQLPERPAIEVAIIALTPEQAADLAAAHALERAKRDSGN